MLKFNNHSALLIIVFILLLTSSCGEKNTHDRFEEDIQLIPEALGKFSLSITTQNEKAQSFFDQGFQLMYAYGKDYAGRSFRKATKLDPECAMCYWGKAWAYGANVNHQMRPSDSPMAYSAINKASELVSKSNSELEKALIDAMKIRYEKSYDESNRTRLDTLYAKYLADVYEKFPDNHDVAVLYAEALFLLEPRHGYRDIDKPELKKIHSILEEVIEEDVNHAGACHLYIHSIEATQEPERGVLCAEHLGDAIPGASHINHMPSHIWNQLGYWDRSVNDNIKAWHSDLKAHHNQGFSIYPNHNLQMISFAASMDGQGAIAIQAGKDYSKLRGQNSYQLLALVRFGRFDEIFELPKSSDHLVHESIWFFSQGYAHLKQNNYDRAKRFKNQLRSNLEDAKGDRFRGQKAEDILFILYKILDGEINRSLGNNDIAKDEFKEAVERHDQLNYEEPETLPFTPRHWLGALLIEMENFEEAEKVYREDLERYPNNGWSLFGLKQALMKQEKHDENVKKKFEKSWARSDTWLYRSAF